MTKNIINFNQTKYFASYGTGDQLPPSERPEFVFCGRSNVGKSSLINKLCNQKKLARTSLTPGKTATINFYDAGSLFLVDLPGYGYAKTSAAERKRWNALIDHYFSSQRQIHTVVQLIDSRHEPSENDKLMFDYLSFHQMEFVVALTKSDKLNKTEFSALKSRFEYVESIPFCKGLFITSAENGKGIEELSRALLFSLTQ